MKLHLSLPLLLYSVLTHSLYSSLSLSLSLYLSLFFSICLYFGTFLESYVFIRHLVTLTDISGYQKLRSLGLDVGMFSPSPVVNGWLSQQCINGIHLHRSSGQQFLKRKWPDISSSFFSVFTHIKVGSISWCLWKDENRICSLNNQSFAVFFVLYSPCRFTSFGFTSAFKSNVFLRYCIKSHLMHKVKNSLFKNLLCKM